MKIRVLFDNLAGKEGLSTGWGLSLLIGGGLLFDTGEKGSYLLRNAKRLGVDLERIDEVVISHDHWDHTGGLWDLLKRRPGIVVHGCPGFGGEFRKKTAASGGRLEEHRAFVRIKEGIYLTGEIAAEYKHGYLGEQALVIDAPPGLVVCTGCAHPGILTVLDRIRENLPDRKIAAVLGGFHLLGEREARIRQAAEGFRARGVERAGPMHCSGLEAQNIFRGVYKDRYIDLKTGDSWEV